LGEVADTLILKTGSFPPLPTIAALGIMLRTGHASPLSRSDLVLWPISAVADGRRVRPLSEGKQPQFITAQLSIRRCILVGLFQPKEIDHARRPTETMCAVQTLEQR
jgi:hypothetical protein